MRGGAILLLATAAVAAAAWLLLRTPGEELVPEEPPTADRPVRAPPVDREESRPAPLPSPPSRIEREALWSPDEDLGPAPVPERLIEAPVGIESPGRDDQHSVWESGGRIRTAFLAIPGLLLRWQDEAAKRRFLETNFRLPPDVAVADGVRGAPLAVVARILDESEAFSVTLSPPVLRIGFEDWTPR